MAVGRPIPEAARDLLIRWYLAPDSRRHVNFPGDPTVWAVSTTHLQKACGGGRHYQAVLSSMFDLVDPSFRPGHHTKAWRLTPKGEARIVSWLSSREPKAEGAYEVLINRAALEQYVGSGSADLGTEAHARALLQLSIPAEFGLGFLREDYSRRDLIGRRFVDGYGLQLITKQVRSVALRETGIVDVDISNAHPELISQLVPGLATLRDLCVNRSVWLEQLQERYGTDRSGAKVLLLMLVYGARINGPSHKRWLERIPTKHPPLPVQLRELSDDMRRAETFILDRYGGLLQGVEKRTKGGMMSLVVQHFEDQVLQSCEEYFHQRGERVKALFFDGFLVDGPVDCQDLRRHVQSRTGFDLRFEVTEFDDERSVSQCA